MRWTWVLFSAATAVALLSSLALADLVCEGPFSNVIYGRPGRHDDSSCLFATSPNYAVDGMTTVGGISTRSCDYSPGHFLQYELDGIQEVGGGGIRLYAGTGPLEADDLQNIQIRLYGGSPYFNYPPVWVSGLLAYNPSAPFAPIVVSVPAIRADHIRILKVDHAGGTYGFSLLEVEIDGRPCFEANPVPALSARNAAALVVLLFTLGLAALWMRRSLA